MNSLIVAIDFDRTIAYQEEDLIPKRLLPNAKEVINWLYSQGCKVIIWTCRDKEHLENAINFLKSNGVKFHSVNKQVVDFTTSPKVYSDIIIDDKNIESIGQPINWLRIKKTIKKLLVERLANEILKIKTSSRKF